MKRGIGTTKIAMIPFVGRHVLGEEVRTLFQPALPVRLKTERFTLEKYALIDTGADVCSINRKVIEKEASSYLANRLLRIELRGITEYMPCYSFDLDICGPEFKTIRTLKQVTFVATELPLGCDIILGREGVLDSLRLTLDYKKRQVEIEFPAEEQTQEQPSYLTEANSLIESGNYNAGVGALSAGIEHFLLDMAQGFRIGLDSNERMTLGKLGEKLFRTGLLNKPTMRLLSEFTGLRNAAIHGSKPLAISDAEHALVLANQIMSLLQIRMNQQPSLSAALEVITVSEMDTTIEYVDNLGNSTHKNRRKLFIKAMQCKDIGLYSEASDYLAEALSTGVSGSERIALLVLLGTTHLRTGNLEESMNLYKQAADEATATQDRLGLAAALGNLGIANKLSGRFEEAQRTLETAIALSEEIDFISGKVSLLMNLADVNLSVGREEAANIYFQIAASLMNALEERDSYTRGHSNRVAEMATAIAKQLGLSQKEIDMIQKAALFHDIGMIAIPDNVLLKTGPLKESEFAMIRSHPGIAAGVLGGSKESRAVATIIRSHHEHYNGSGFPDGLKGDEIPIGARVIAVADVYDAMASDRPYRSRLTDHEIREELIRCSDRLLDPEVVEAFIKSKLQEPQK